MDKFLKIGEQYVQWIGLALGAAFLIMMGMFYVAQPPSELTIEMDHKSYLPGEIDEQIKKGPITQIVHDIKDPTVWVALKPPRAVEDIKLAFVDQAPQVVPTTPAPIEDRIGPGPIGLGQQPPTLVKAPAPEVSPQPIATGYSTLDTFKPVPPAAVQPAVAVPAQAAAAPVQPVIEPKDLDWVTLPWTVSTKALDAAFQTANIPNFPNIYRTAFLHVQLFREELLPNGKWGNQKPILDIPTASIDPLPSEKLPPNPDKVNYLAQAAANAENILTPPFFTVGYGTPWYAPGTPKPNDVFAPAGAPLPGAVPALPAPALAPRGAPGLAPAGAFPPRGIIHGPGLPAPAIAPAAPLMPAPARPQPAIAPPPGVPGAPPMLAPGAFGQGNLNPAGNGGFINPQVDPDVTIYTHDWTVEPGHTYHYSIRYWISNPLFQVQQQNVKQADQDLLAIPSPFSAWTAPIEIPSHFKFWVQNFQRNGNNEVTFDLFTKKPSVPGGLERSTVRATPGDSIGPSPWLLVDVRPDSIHRTIYYFLIAGPTGQIERHDLDKDKNDPDHVEMRDRTGASAAALGAGG